MGSSRAIGVEGEVAPHILKSGMLCSARVAWTLPYGVLIAPWHCSPDMPRLINRGKCLLALASWSRL